MPDLKPGSVVRLRSGGPIMTIRGAVSSDHRVDDANSWLHVDWFENHLLHSAVFAAAQLVELTAEELHQE
ncbi:MAG: DUF2158 domain-containing protein, partial [Patescibacteria group bacterium]|nr:DUF2158 domain-containing protein [Patescibacteria group bacterium]